MSLDTPSSLSRRHFLRAAGISLALPFLPSLGWRAFAQAAAPAKSPQRFAFIYTPNGYNQKAFVPAATGADWELTPALSPLAKLKSDVTLVTGLDRKQEGGLRRHAAERATIHYLAARTVMLSKATEPPGLSARGAAARPT